MKEIPLSQEGKNRGKYVALVDDEDYEYLNQWKWSAHRYRDLFYAERTYWIGKKQYREKMHWLIMSQKWIDHIDLNGLNNQRENLRPCNNSQNNMNRIKQKNSSSKFKGVTFRNKENKYISKIRINGVLIYLGYFKDEIEAAKAYDAKAIELFGEFARINFK